MHEWMAVANGKNQNCTHSFSFYGFYFHCVFFFLFFSNNRWTTDILKRYIYIRRADRVAAVVAVVKIRIAIKSLRIVNLVTNMIQVLQRAQEVLHHNFPYHIHLHMVSTTLSFCSLHISILDDSCMFRIMRIFFFCW